MTAAVRVVFVVPYALDTSLRFARAVAALPGVLLGVVTQEDPGRLPADLRGRLTAVERIDDALAADQIEGAVVRMGASLGGPVARLVGVLEQLQVPLAVVRERLRIRGMDANEAHNFRDKARMKDTLRAHDVPCARHQLAADAAQARTFADQCGFPLVVKPPAGAGARGTFRVAGPEELESYLHNVPPSAAEPALLEEFMTGTEHSFDSVSLHGKHLLHSVSVYTPTPLEVMNTPWIQWRVVLPRHVDGHDFADIHAVGRRALEVLGMVTGITHMEWFRRPDGSLAISEVAARPPGAQFTSLLSYAHDVDFYEAWARLLVHETFEQPQRRFSAGAVYLRGQGKGRVVAVRGARELAHDLGDTLVELKLPEPGAAPTHTYEGDGYAIVRHPETAVVEKALAHALQCVRIELG
jgi:biotin carboxylase